jgi:hypothetical protein
MEYYKPRPEQPAPIQPTQPAPANSVPSTPVAPTPAPVLAIPTPVVASQPVKRPDGQRDYKYTQEISQMVRISDFLRFCTPSSVRCLSLGRFRIRTTRPSISSRTSCAVSSSNSYVIPRATSICSRLVLGLPGPCARQPSRRPIPHCRRPHLPYPTRQR